MSTNKWHGIGNLGKDPDLRYMPSGESVANFSIAITEKWKGKDGSKQEKTEWVNIVAFKKLGEICGEYLRKGSKVYIEGKLQTRKWQDKSGADRYTTEILANSMEMLSSRQEGGQSASAPSLPADDFDQDIPF